jgi:phosphatidylglycerol:prolipoprotein diacylglycerol transferase
MAVIPFPSIDPVLFEIPIPFIGWLPIRWYALAYIAGLLGAWWFIVKMVRTERLWKGAPFDGKPQVTADQVGDLFVWVALGVILGGRIGYILFYGLVYEWEAYAAQPWRVFYTWEGGMSFHGGAIGVLVAVILFARRNKLDMVALGDLVCVAQPIGQFFGRLANFINGELWGKPSDAPWAMVFPSADSQPRHPSQLYEAALEGIVLFAILAVLVYRFDALKRPGLCIAVFWAGYALFRGFVEIFYRDSSAQMVGAISMGTLLSIFMFGVAALFFWYSLYRKGPALLVK